MRGNIDVRHFAIYGKHHWDRQRVVHLDSGGHSLPNSGGNFNSADGSRRGGLESHHVEQVLLGHLIEEGHLNQRKRESLVILHIKIYQLC